jgi:hypothetical protein
MGKIPPKEMSLEDIEKALGYPIKLVPRTRTQIVNVPNGEVFQIGDVEFIVLKGGVKVFAITKDVIGEGIFGTKSNSYEHSALQLSDTLRKFEFYLRNNIKAENLLARRVDLTSDNGFKDYDVTTSYVAPMSLDEYRQFSCILEEHEVNSDWWLVTPHGTNTHNKSRSVCYITQDGMLEHVDCDIEKGIRPMICLSCSTIVGYDGKKLN